MVFGLFRRLGSEEHQHVPTLELGWLFDVRDLGTRLGKATHGFQTHFGMPHLATAETDADLDLVAVLQELGRLRHLGVDVTDVGVQSQTHLFDVNDVLVLTRFLLFLR